MAGEVIDSVMVTPFRETTRVESWITSSTQANSTLCDCKAVRRRSIHHCGIPADYTKPAAVGEAAEEESSSEESDGEDKPMEDEGSSPDTN